MKNRFRKISVSALALTLSCVMTFSFAGCGKKKAANVEVSFNSLAKNSVSAVTSQLSEGISDLQDVSDNAVSGSFEIKLDESSMDLLKLTGLDLKPCSAAINYDVCVDGDQLGLNLKLNLDGKDLISGNIALDCKTGMLYASVPDLNKQAIQINLFDAAELDLSEAQSTFAMIAEVQKILPDGKTIGKIVNRSLCAAIDEITKTDKTNKTFKVGGLEKKYDVYTAVIDEELAGKMATAFLKSIRDDADIKSFVKGLGKIDDLKDMVEGDWYKAYVEKIDEAIKAVNEEPEDEADEEDEADVVMETNGTLYYSLIADSKGNLCGAEMTAKEDDEVVMSISSITIQKGGKYAEEVKIEAEDTNVVFSGEGTVSGKKYTGDYALTVNDKTYANVSFKNFVKDGAKCSGSAEVSLTKEVLSALREQGVEVPKQLDETIGLLKLSFKFDRKDNSSSNTMEINLQNKTLFTVLTKLDVTKKFEIAIPKDAVDFNNESALQAWTGSMNMQKMIELQSNLSSSNFVKNITALGELINLGMDDEIDEDWDEADWDGEDFDF
ncbi:MAG: hypothetical protein MJ132_04595 [Clostridia bacterium]|nr:hypothetical protein [Clostridia bacterium]